MVLPPKEEDEPRNTRTTRKEDKENHRGGAARCGSCACASAFFRVFRVFRGSSSSFYRTAIGLPGEPVAPFSRSGAKTKANSYTLSRATSSRSRFSRL